MNFTHLVYSLLIILFNHKEFMAYKITSQTLNPNQLTIEVEPAEENTEDYVVPLALIQDIYSTNSEPILNQALSSYLETENMDSNSN